MAKVTQGHLIPFDPHAFASQRQQAVESCLCFGLDALSCPPGTVRMPLAPRMMFTIEVMLIETWQPILFDLPKAETFAHVPCNPVSALLCSEWSSLSGLLTA